MNRDVAQNDYNIKSLIKALDILEILIENGHMSIGEISSKSSMGKSSVHRILGTFKKKGYINQVPEDGRYYATTKIFELGNRAANNVPIRTAAKPYLEELFEKCHETVNLAILDSNEIVFLDKIITREPLRIDLDIGRRVPAYCSGLGKALLAFSKNVNPGSMEFKKFTDKTVGSAEELSKELESIRLAGCSIDNEEYIKGLVCLAAPILDRGKNAIAAVSIAAPAVRIDESKKNEYLSMLKCTTEKISKSIGC